MGTLDSVRVFINSDLQGKASLHVTRTRLSWVMESGQTFSLDYPSINMHSISRDTTVFPHECLFLMVDGNLRAKVEAIMRGESPTLSKGVRGRRVCGCRRGPSRNSRSRSDRLVRLL